MNGDDDIDGVVRALLRDVLAIPHARVEKFTPETPLFGAVPELDSMAVAGLLTEMEDRLGFVIDDAEVDAEMLSTFGALADFARSKLNP